jgi:hypothetical protein
MSSGDKEILEEEALIDIQQEMRVGVLDRAIYQLLVRVPKLHNATQMSARVKVTRSPRVPMNISRVSTTLHALEKMS